MTPTETRMQAKADLLLTFDDIRDLREDVDRDLEHVRLLLEQADRDAAEPDECLRALTRLDRDLPLLRWRMERLLKLADEALGHARTAVLAGENERRLGVGA